MARLGRNVVALGAVSFLTDVSSEMIYPLLPVFLSGVLGVNASFIGAIEGAAESTASLLKLASGWWSDRVRKRKPLMIAGYGLASFVRPLMGIVQTGPQALWIRVTDRVGKGLRTAPRDALLADSVNPDARGRAFGFHSASDNAGAVLGPLVAFALLHALGVPIRTVFLLAAIPAALAFVTLIMFVREVESARAADARGSMGQTGLGTQSLETGGLGRIFWMYLFLVLLFTLGNSTDAFLLLRANQLGVAVALAPVLWALLNLVRAVLGTWGGALSDRVGRKPLIVGGWLVYAAVYVGFAAGNAAWHAWALFAIYGLFYALTEGTQRAMIADIVPPHRRGAAYGWYNLAIGLGALPASLLFGAIWDASGAEVAFAFGAALALLAGVGMMLLPLSSTAKRG